jgi:hypothetical protein
MRSSGAVAVLAAALLGTPPARAACASAVYVEGYRLFGAMAREYDLPPDDGTVAAVFPACTDGGGSEYDEPGTVTRLEGVPPTVAVRKGSIVFVAKGQMRVLADHPLQTETPKRRNCRPGPTVRRKAVAESDHTVLGRGRGTVQIDAQTRLTNYSPTTPVVTGQRFHATTSRCGRRNVADALTFVRPILEPQRYEPNIGASGAGHPSWAGVPILIGIAITLAGLITFLVLTVALREKR